MSCLLGLRSDGACVPGSDEARCALAPRKEIHPTNASACGWRVESFGKASDGDESDTLGGPFIVVHVVSPASCMMYWVAVSDSKDTDIDSVVREGPHRRAAEETVEFRSVRANTVSIDKSTFKD